MKVSLDFSSEDMITFLENKGYQIGNEPGKLFIEMPRYTVTKDKEVLWSHEDAMRTKRCGLEKFFTKEFSSALIKEMS